MHILLNEISSSQTNFTKIISRILFGLMCIALKSLLLFEVFLLRDRIKSGYYFDFWLVRKQLIRFEPN